eukprot:CAMPEP_0115875578 /NCGR_PEP_ID=MMETSP0287-20121206/25170_1 /TAXON_ID=412157 /ORGANISM="Chrysochromulina rotalis, Strain UIO044" /LENGTH=56 /DNA_ID=CAMNT_0003330847 /DNA_START=692 /DNA_END=862 /DNA_ORIENTATION=+
MEDAAELAGQVISAVPTTRDLIRPEDFDLGPEAAEVERHERNEVLSATNDEAEAGV